MLRNRECIAGIMYVGERHLRTPIASRGIGKPHAICLVFSKYEYVQPELIENLPSPTCWMFSVKIVQVAIKAKIQKHFHLIFLTHR